MSNWTYSEHDGKHIINDERGVLVAMVCDAQTAELIVHLREQLADKTEYFDIKQKLWQLVAEGGSLQQQVAERERIIVELATERDILRDIYGWNEEVHKVVDENNRLRKALEEARERCAGRGVKTTMLNRQSRKMRNLLRDIRSEGVGDKFSSKIDRVLGDT